MCFFVVFFFSVSPLKLQMGFHRRNATSSEAGQLLSRQRVQTFKLKPFPANVTH